MDMQALIGEMNDLIVKIKNGTATLGEIEAFAAAATQMHERAIVLRYKAYEAKVFGAPVAAPAEQQPEPEPVTAPVAPAPVPEAPAAAPSAPAEEPEEVSFDLFEESDGETFDLFSLDETADEEPAQIEVPAPAAPVQAAEKPAAEPFADAAPLAPLIDPVHETIAQEPLQPAGETALTEEATTPVHAEPEPAAPVMAEPELAEETSAISETPAPAPEAPAASPAFSGDIHPVYKRLVTDDNSLAARLMAVRLETLKGAFGFNERLQIIRELFDGSSDIFTQVIDQLDTTPTKEEARRLVSGYANRYGWDKDSDLALEFIQKVERRYA